MPSLNESKESLQHILINDYEILPKELENKTKKELLGMIKKLDDENVLDNLTIETEGKNNIEPIDRQTPIPTFSEYGWHDYVMSHFEEDELVEGSPTVDGLRRVCELLIGKIVEISNTVLQFPSPENERRATVKSRIVIENDTLLIYEGAADVYPGNTDGIYARHPVALAETRAEGRALKRALRLRKVISAEEIGSGQQEEAAEQSELNKPINDNQKMFINMICDKSRLNLNIDKAIKVILPKVKNSTELKYGEAKELIMKLDEYQRKPESILEDIKGFDSSFKFS